MPYLGNEPAVAYTSTTKDTFSGDASTTDFTMSKSANVNAVRVVVENVVQNPTVAYTCSGTTLSFTSAPPTGTNNIYVVHLGPPAATVAPPTTINNATTFTGGLTLKNETAEDTDGGRESIVTFQGTQSGNEITTLAQIQASHDGTSDDEAGDLIFRTNDGSDGASPTEAMRIDSAQNIAIGTTAPTTFSGFKTLHFKNGSGDAISLVESDGGVISQEISADSTGVTLGSRSNHNLRITTNDTEHMRIDSDGKVRVGGNSATMSNNLTVEGASYTLFGMKRNTGVTTGTGEFAIHMETNSQTSISYDDEGVIAFGTAGTPTTAAGFSEKIRIKSDGVLVVGSTSDIRASSQTGCSVEPQGRIYMSRGTGTGAFSHLVFYNGNGAVGSVQTSGSATSYNTSSDYRLKENVTDISDGITRIKQLAPKRFNFIADADTTVDGFLAHEAATVVPEAVTGTKDALMNEEYEVTAAKGDVYTAATEEAEEIIHSSDVEKPDTLENGQQWREKTAAVMGTRSVPDYQGIDQSKIVPLLTAALQEAIAKIETLETKVAALEAG